MVDAQKEKWPFAGVKAVLGCGALPKKEIMQVRIKSKMEERVRAVMKREERSAAWVVGMLMELGMERYQHGTISANGSEIGAGVFAAARKGRGE